MIVIGLYREQFPETSRSLPSIHASVCQLCESDAIGVARYLALGVPVFDFMEVTRDPLDHTRIFSGGSSLLTDGEWVWRQDFQYLMQSYKLAVPEKFLDRVRSNPSEPEMSVEIEEAGVAALKAYQEAISD